MNGIILENLSTQGDPSDRDCTSELLTSLSQIIPDLRRCVVKNLDSDEILCNECYEDTIFYDRKYIAIPEKTIEGITSSCYLDTEDILKLLKGSRYYHHKIIPDSFYHELTIKNEFGEEECVSVLFMYSRIMQRIRTDIYNRENRF